PLHRSSRSSTTPTIAGASIVLRKALVLFAVSSASLAAQAAQVTQAASQVRPLPIIDALSAGRFANTVPVRLSPDAQWVTYSVIDPRRQPAEGALGDDYSIITKTGVTMTVATSDVWVSNVNTGDARNITKGQGASWGGVWSPDGRSLAFFSDRDGNVHVWLWDLASGGVRRVSDVIVRPYFTFEQIAWHPDGKQLLVRVLPEGFTLDQVLDRVRPQLSQASSARPNVRLYEWPVASRDSAATSRSQLSALSGDLAMIDVQTGAARRLVHNVKTNAYWISPRGTDVAFMQRVDDHSSVQQMYDLGVVSIAGGKSRVLAHDIPQPFGLSVSWSPDGSQLAYTDALGTSATSGPRPKGDCFVVALAGGSPRNVSTRAHSPFGKSYDAPLWHPNGQWIYLLGGDTVWRASAREAPLVPVTSLTGRSLLQMMRTSNSGTLWMPDGDETIYVRTQVNADSRMGIARVNISSSQIANVIEEERNYVGGMFGMDAAGRTLVHLAEGAQAPPDLWVARGSDSIAHARRLTHLNPQLDGYEYGASRLITWQTSDGAIIHGVLVLPAGYVQGKKYPLIAHVYGGDSPSRDVYWFGGYHVGMNLRQLFATRGYAMLLPDIPLHVGTPMADIEKAVLPGISSVVDMGVADPDRLGVTGASYGGYTTLALITQTKRFKAAVSIYGLSNLVSDYGLLLRGGASGTTNMEQGAMRMGVSPWENLTRYIDNSPYYHLDRVETPVLLIHGDADIAVPSARGDETFVALRRLGKTVQYAKYAGEGHGWWGFADSLDAVQRTIAWFDQYLAPAQSTARR
ncbi:MAG: hypothetical protein JWM95_3834, partial [Gemmatimonadetes bacterium]|nr:hypothetical protein [Gemmatimonadota bacterium]